MSKYKDFGIALLVFWIFLFLFALYITYIYLNKISSPFKSYISNLLSKSNNETNIENNILPYVFYNKDDYTMLYLFLFLTLLNFVFSLVHGIYLYSKKKEDSYTKKDEKDILTTTFVGYFFIFIAHLILFVPIVFNKSIGTNNNITTLITGLVYGVLMIIGVILISVGLSGTREKDKKMKELKSASIMAPVLIAITGILYGIIPACYKLLNPDGINPSTIPSTIPSTNPMKKSNSNKAIKLTQILKERSSINPLVETNSSKQFIENIQEAAKVATKNPFF